MHTAFCAAAAAAATAGLFWLPLHPVRIERIATRASRSPIRAAVLMGVTSRGYFALIQETRADVDVCATP
jgi:hypothetical protein